MDERCRIHHLERRCCFAQRDDVSLSFWQAPPTLELAEMQRVVLERVIAEHGRLMALTLFRFVHSQPSALRDAVLRWKFEDIARLVDGSLTAHALVIEVPGFASMFVHASATALGALMRSKVRTKVFSEPQSAARWLAEQREGGARPGEVEALSSLVAHIVERLRESWP